MVEAEVKDRYGRYMSGLNYREFIIYDNGQQQEIAYCLEEKGSDTEEGRITYKIGYFEPDGMPEGDLRRVRVKLCNAKKRGLKVSYSPKSYFVTITQ